ERHMRLKILEHLFCIFETDDIFQQIFSARNVSYDVVYHLIQMENSAFGFKYSNFRQLLIDFGFLNSHPDKQLRKLIVDPRCKRLFDKYLLSTIKKKKLGIEGLRAALEQKQIQGLEAEEFVVKFEKERLSSHARVDDVARISDYDVSAGYDIVSFDDVKSLGHNRFIEVKSYSAGLRFFWSKNEVSQARIRRNQYFLYLVDSREISKPGYTPMIIQNPHDKVFSDDSWIKEASEWMVTRLA
ncbi:MAG: DUF3883 domain-containing protein, partial [Minisyncoccia bacterium]